VSVNKEAVGGILVSAVMVGLMALGGWLAWEPAEYTTKTVSGEVIGHSRGASGKSAADPYFIVVLESGLQVHVKDYGSFPITYNGPVELHVGKSPSTGLARYRFTERSRNKSLNLTPQSGAN
jgi:hypothetical protein